RGDGLGRSRHDARGREGLPMRAGPEPDPFRVRLTVDDASSARRIAADAVEFLARAAGLTDRRSRDLTMAFSEAGRRLSRGGERPHCDLVSREGVVRLSLWSEGAARRGTAALLARLRSRVTSAGVRRISGRVVIVQKRDGTPERSPA